MQNCRSIELKMLMTMSVSLSYVLVKRALPLHLMKYLMKELLVTGFTSSFDEVYFSQRS